MTGLPKFFTATSDKPYDRHYYRFVCHDGTELEFDNYEDVQFSWTSMPPEYKSFVKAVVVVDPPTSGKGF